MITAAQSSVDSYKRKAARLLKAARSGDGEARARFDCLSSRPLSFQLKHALCIVALEAGYESWAALKLDLEGLDFSTFFATPGLRNSLNPWFATYDEARAFQLENGGILLPYKSHVFVSEADILPRLGYEADHPDWSEMGYDFVRPLSEAAHARIKAALTRRFGAAAKI